MSSEIKIFVNHPSISDKLVCVFTVLTRLRTLHRLTATHRTSGAGSSSHALYLLTEHLLMIQDACCWIVRWWKTCFRITGVIGCDVWWLLLCSIDHSIKRSFNLRLLERMLWVGPVFILHVCSLIFTWTKYAIGFHEWLKRTMKRCSVHGSKIPVALCNTCNCFTTYKIS